MKHQILSYSAVIILVFGLFTACENKPTESTEETSTKSTEQLVQEGDSLIRNIDIQWKEMEYADDALMENSKVLADTIATLEGLNQSLYDSITIFVDEIKSLKYDQQSISNGEQIDKFDGAVTNLVNAVQRLQETTQGGADCIVCDGILKVIKEIDNEYVIRRKKYDIEADKFNKFVEANQEMLQKLDAEKYQKLPLFSIIE